MCDHCHSSPCIGGCPNQTQTDWGACKYCGRPIVEDEDYIEDGYDVLHLECLKDMIESDPRAALEMLGLDCLRAGE